MNESKTPRPIILEIPANGPLPPMWDKSENKQEILKWLDDKPCIYGSFSIDGEYRFVINALDYIIYEWLEKYYISYTNCELTVDELIKVFENKEMSEHCEENLNQIINNTNDEDKY